MSKHDLIAKLEAATEGSRELDAEISFDCFASPIGKHTADGGPSGYLWPEDHPSWAFGLRFPGKDRAWFDRVRKGDDRETLVIERDGALVLMNELRVLKFTTSLDAARTLVPEGWDWEVGVTSGTAEAILTLPGNGFLSDRSDTERYGRHEDPVIALCIAILRAMEANDEQA